MRWAPHTIRSHPFGTHWRTCHQHQYVHLGGLRGIRERAVLIAPLSVRRRTEATTSLDQRLVPHDVAGVDAICDATVAFNACLSGLCVQLVK